MCIYRARPASQKKDARKLLFTITALAGLLACPANSEPSGVPQNDSSDTASVSAAVPTPAPPANVIFSDDFESGTLGKWQDGVNAAKHRVVHDASRAADGSHYLEITFPAGGNGGWLTRFFMPGYDSLYVSYDV